MKGCDHYYYSTFCRELFYLNTDIYTTHLYMKHTHASAETVWQYGVGVLYRMNMREALTIALH